MVDDDDDPDLVVPPAVKPPAITVPLAPAAPKPSPAQAYPYVNDPLVPGRRMFNDAAVQRALDQKLAALPEGATGAVIAHADTQGNASLSVIGKKGEHWTYLGELDHSPTDPISGMVEVRYSW